jgi:hypothetical protein
LNFISILIFIGAGGSGQGIGRAAGRGLPPPMAAVPGNYKILKFYTC